MGERKVERRLAAILAADVAGYSRLVGEDEEGTLERLRVPRRRNCGIPRAVSVGHRLAATFASGRELELSGGKEWL
jgi:adenylate cyclase